MVNSGPRPAASGTARGGAALVVTECRSACFYRSARCSNIQRPSVAPPGRASRPREGRGAEGSARSGSRALGRTRHDLADINSDWLAGFIRHPLERLSAKVDRATVSARTASLAVDATPGLLGERRPMRYLLMFTTPSEARSTGFMGNWGVLTADNGRLQLTDSVGLPSSMGPATQPCGKSVDRPTSSTATHPSTPRGTGVL